MSKADSPGLRRVRDVLAKATGPLSAQDIAALAHVSSWTFNNHYKAGLLREKAMHVAGWERYGYGWMPQYAKGIGVTPKKPKAPHPRVSTKLWRDRTGYNEARKSQRRMARPRDPILAALLGIKPGYRKSQPGEQA